MTKATANANFLETLSAFKTMGHTVLRILPLKQNKKKVPSATTTNDRQREKIVLNVSNLFNTNKTQREKRIFSLAVTGKKYENRQQCT